MKKAKKILYLALTYVLVGVLCIAGTIAYLTSEDSDVNVMTLGNVEIEQLEYERVVDENGDFKLITTNDGTGYKLQDFTQSKKLNPAYGEAEDDQTLVYFDQLGKAEGSDAPIANLKGAQDKYVFVKNTGINDAYVRTLIAYEVGAIENAFGDLIIAETSDYYTAREVGVITVDGNKYYLVEYTYKGSDDRHAGGVLPSGEFTYNSLAQVYMNKKATNADVKAIDGNENGTYDILVLSQAVQVDNFPNATTALNEAFGVVNASNAAQWFAKGQVSNPNIDFTENEDEDAIEVEGTDKTSVLDAIADAQDGDVIVLTDDTVISGYAATNKLIIEKDITLDLNGQTITTECGWGGIDLKGGASIVNGVINHTGNTAAIKVFQGGKIENVVINVTETDGKTKGGIVVQEGGCYVESIKNVVINGVTNGIETYRCGNRTDYAIGSIENVTINATHTGISLSAPVGTIKNCTINGEVYGINAYLYGPYSVSANLVNCTVSGATDIYAHDEAGKTNPGSMNIVLDSTTAVDCKIVKDFEAEVSGRVFVGVK